MKKLSGFTLIEVLIASVILMTLITTTLQSVNIRTNFQTAQDVTRKSDLAMLEKSFVQYFVDHHGYPSTDEWNAFTCDGPVPTAFKPYMSTFPCDPETHQKYYYEPLNAQCQKCTDGHGSCGGLKILTKLAHMNDPMGVVAGCDPLLGCGVNAPDGTPYNYGVALKPGCNIMPPTPTVGFNNTSSILIPNSATFTFTYSGTSSNTYIIDMSTRADMSGDVYLTFGQGSGSPVKVTSPGKWDKYICGQKFYWTVKSQTGIKSTIQSATVDCQNMTPTPTPYGSFINLSAGLLPTQAAFNFTYTGFPVMYIVDMSISPNMSSGTYLTFGQDRSSWIIVNNPTKWDQYVCGKMFYWTVRSETGIKSTIQSNSVYCTPTPTPIPTASPTPTITPGPSPTPITTTDPPVTRNVMVIDFNPLMENRGNVRLRSAAGWNDPVALENQYISDIRTASGGYLNYHIVTRLANVDSYPTKNTGYVFTDDAYWRVLTDPSARDANANAIINYNKVVTDYDVCGKVNRGEIDELWLWGGPWFGYWEALMAGPGAFNTNAPPLSGTTCTRPLHIMGFSYERGISEMLEDFGHRTEGTMRNFYGGWFTGGNTDWDRFTKGRAFHPSDGTFPYGCGSVHEPFNAGGGYDWSNTTTVPTTCAGWIQYPPVPTATQSLTCSAWGCSGYGYLKWWLAHLPKVTGTTNGKWNDWWRYLAGEY